MNFKQWFTKTGLTMWGLARVCYLSRGTIKNLVEGKNPDMNTVKKLVRFTKNMQEPVTYDLFKKIRGKRKDL